MKGKILAYGEIMMRLSAPDGKTVRESSCFSANYGGTEANVLACLHAFGRETKYLTALPEGPLGEFNMRVGLAGYGNIGREIHAILRANGIAT